MGIFSRRAVGLALTALSLFAAAPDAGALPSKLMSGRIMATSGAVTLTAGATRVPLLARAEAGSLRGQLADLGGRQLFLVFDDLKASEQPGVIYEIYLGLPPGPTPKAGDPHYVGTLNFFAVAPPNTSRLSRSYNVTALIPTLLAQGLSDDNLAATIVGIAPAPSPSVANPSIGAIELVVQ
jgi:tyrosinase